jgi:periplasmic protein TonB
LKKNKPNIPDFDDLIFESRNKDYGAYRLRKRYNYVVITGIIIASLIGCFVVIVPFTIKPSSDQILIGGYRSVQLHLDNLELPKEMIYVPPSPSPPKLKNIQDIVTYVAPEVIDTILPIENALATPDEILASTENNTSNLNYIGTGDDNSYGVDGPSLDESFVMVEVMPTFRGGNELKFREWVQRRTYYPKEAIDKKILGTVFITFIIEKDGSVSNVSIVKGVDPLLDNEAVKVISESPKWSPGLQRGQPVRVRFLIPLVFAPT